MTNYTQTNIYRRQMQELGLNPKQYAKLIDMPYEVVKDMLYDKEGDYSMEISKILRKNMFNKHQDIENNFDNAKYEAMRIKKEDDEIDYLDWYYKEYSADMLKSKLNVSSITDFERKFCIVVNEKRASHWYYTILCGKKEYEGHQIEKNNKLEFITQLYDIVVNDNGKAYYGKKANFVMNTQTPNGKINYVKWYKTFDIKQFMSDNNLNNSILVKELEYSPAVISRLINKKKYTRNLLTKLYDYVMSQPNNNDVKSNSFDYFEWFKNFDLKKYMKQNNLTNTTLGAKLGLGIVSISQLANKKFYTKKTLEKLYSYINAQKHDEKASENEVDDYDDVEILDDEQDDNNTTTIYDRNLENDAEIEVLDTNETPQDDSTTELVDDYTPKMESQSDNYEILRKILANRLTDEEKELIKIFGGIIC